MQAVIIIFICILVISFITGLFITYFEKKAVRKAVVDNAVIDFLRDVDCEKKEDVVSDVVELLEETMILDVPEIMKVLNDDEEIETI